MLQAYWGQIGVTVELVGIRSDDGTSRSSTMQTALTFLLKTTGSTDYIVNQWKLCWDKRDYESLTGGAANFTQDDELQSLMEAALKHQRPTVRRASKPSMIIWLRNATAMAL